MPGMPKLVGPAPRAELVTESSGASLSLEAASTPLPDVNMQTIAHSSEHMKNTLSSPRSERRNIALPVRSRAVELERKCQRWQGEQLVPRSLWHAS